METVLDTAVKHRVRVDYVPAEHYTSREYLQREKRQLWPKVWQLACRLEEIPFVGDYVTYDILDESIIVVRQDADTIRAYHNVCPHRGRRLTEGCGTAARLQCKFHGWQWNLDGKVIRIIDRDDWAGCPDNGDEDFTLPEIKVSTWAGFVFVNFDPDCEPLETHLAPVPEYTNCYEFEKMRYRWYKSVRLPCNWKVALEAFNEGYHVFGTHPQLLDTQGDDTTRSFTFGKHGMFGYPTATRLTGAPSPRTGRPVPDDVRPGIVKFFTDLEEQLAAITTASDAEASKRILTECPPDMPHLQLLMKAGQFQAEAAIAAGAGYPNITPEQVYKAGTDWHVFPNMVFLMSPNGMLFYRARPDGDDPDSCFYDIGSLVRYAPGAEPPLKREVYWGKEDWKTDTVERFGLILSQDFANMVEVQRGMKSSAFKGARTNPLQESVISNFHAVLDDMLSSDRTGD
ncbi:SRPBCC family protein [Ideonella sp. B508-1]|uniref:aromatic ring-hydroxylating oxygenase subunit alpha n=1 Tax=Ideonella sp. B508-1 TaxID=137716 RepID=UPI0003B67197|nr:aromatic ring-hydroxylating dioxygenase subunit alpha [Ideonella sp. B508-1]